MDKNFIDCIIQLPEKLFFGTSIATCILVMAKNKKDNNMLFIDASREFKKETNNNILQESNIETIVEVFKNRETKPFFSRLVDREEIEANEYNLSVASYVEKEEEKEVVDIQELNAEIEQIVKRIDELRLAIDEIVKELVFV